MEGRRHSPFSICGPFGGVYQELLQSRIKEEPSRTSVKVETNKTSISSAPISSGLNKNIAQTPLVTSAGASNYIGAASGRGSLYNTSSAHTISQPTNYDSEIGNPKYMKQQRDYRPMRYGDYVLLSSLVEGESLSGTGSLVRGLISADILIRSGISLHLFTDDMDLDIFDQMVLQLCKPVIQSSSAADGEGAVFVDDKAAYGQSLSYGSPFMLKVCMSGNYFIGAEEEKSADIEKSCGRVGNFLVGSSSCHFKLASKYKSRAREVAYYGDQLFIINISANLLLHCGDVNSACGTFEAAELGCRVMTDVNLTRLRDTDSGSFVWEFAEYSSYSDLPCSGVVSTGSFVRIYQPELQSYLSSRMPQYPLQMFKDEIPTCRNGNPLSIFPNDCAVFAFNNRNHASGKHGFVEDAMLCSIFRIERARLLVGGRVKFGESVRLRHAITGCYLAVSLPESSSTSSSKRIDSISLVLSRLANPFNLEAARKFSYETSFVIEAAGSQSGPNVPFGESVRLKHISRLDLKQERSFKKASPSSPSYLYEYRQNFLRDGSIDAANSDLGIDTYLTFSDETIRFLPSYPSVTAKLHSADHAEGTGSDQTTKSVLQSLFSQSYHPAVCVPHYSDADVVQFICVDPVDKLYVLGANTIKRTLHDFEGALRVCSERIGAGMMFKFPQDTLQNAQKVCDEIVQFCNFVDDLEVTVIAIASNAIQSRSLDTQYDMKIRVARQQFIVMDSGILQRLFWLYRSPYYLGISRAFIRENKCLKKLFWSITSAISAVCLNNETVQEYVARSSYSGFRTSGLPIGFISHVFTDLRTDEESASRVLQAAVSSNRLLLDALFDEAVMQGIIQLIREKGPKPSLVKLLASLANAQGHAMIQNQILLMSILYSETSDPKYIYNRKIFLIETALRKPEKPDPEGQFFRSDGELFILWHGTSLRRADGTSVPNGDTNSIIPLFECVNTLKLTSNSVSDEFIEISDRLIHYFSEIKEASKHRWVSLSSIAWTIEPENCFKFEQPGIVSSLAWSARWRQLERSPSEAAVFLRQQRLIRYYAAVLDLFERATADRSTVTILDKLELQLTHNVLFAGMANGTLPLVFRSTFARLLKNIFIDRYPHEDLNLPSLVRCDEKNIRTDGDLRFDSFVASYYCRSRPFLSESGEVTFSSLNPTSIVYSGVKTKFTAVQEVIVRYFVDTKYSKESLISAPLGTLLVRPPSLRVGGSELDSFRFSQILIEIMHLLLRFGFYHNETLLVELIHTVFGVLSSHRYGASHDQLDFEASPEAPDTDTDSDPSDEAAQIELSTVSKQAREEPLTSLYTSESVDDSLINWITNPDNKLDSAAADSPKLANNSKERESSARFHSVPKTINAATKSTTDKLNQAPVPLVKSEELTRICRKHDTVFANKQHSEDEKTEAEVIEHQLLFLGSWGPDTKAYTNPFTTDDKYLIAQKVFSALAPNANPAKDSSNPTAGLPDDLWLWVNNWRWSADFGEGVVSREPEGWVYALTYPKKRSEFSPVKRGYHIIRCRRWVRTRQLKSADSFVGRLYGLGYSEQVILAAIKKNIEPNGIIAMRKVLDCIASVAADVSEQAQVAAEKAAQRSHGIGDELESFSFVPEQSLLSSKQLKSALHTVSNACIAESLSIISYVYDVMTDTRITAFVTFVRHAVAANTPLWNKMELAGSSYSGDKRYTLTPYGETKLRSLFFETSMGASVESGVDNHHRASGSMYCVDGFYLGGEAFLDTMLGFVLSNNHRICDKALDVLRKHFGQRSDFCNSICQVIYSGGNQKHFKSELIRYLLARLQHRIRTLTSSGGCSTVRSETEQISSELSQLILGDDGSVDSVAQDMMRATKAHEKVLYLLQYDFSTFDKRSAASKPLGLSYRRSMCKFLCDFVKNNIENASELSNFFEFLVGTLGSDFDVTIEMSKVIDAILIAGTLKTARRLPATDFFIGVFEEIRKCKTSNYNVASELLCIVKRSLVVGNSFLPLHQSQLLLLLTNNKLIQWLVLYMNSNNGNQLSDYDYKLSEHLFSISNGDGMVDRRNLVMQYVSMTSGGSASVVFSREDVANVASVLRYHADCVELLALTCGGRNLSNALKCRRIIPFEVAVSVLCDQVMYKFPYIVSAFAIYLSYVFFDMDSAIDAAISNLDGDGQIVNHPMVQKVVESIATFLCDPSLKFADQRSNEPNRGFAAGAAMLLFRHILARNSTESNEDALSVMRQKSILSEIQRSVDRLRSFNGWSLAELRSIESVAFALGMPTQFDSAMPLELEISIDGVSAALRMHGCKYTRAAMMVDPSSCGADSNDELDNTKWGSEKLRFFELKSVMTTCPIMESLRWSEADQLVQYILKDFLAVTGRNKLSGSDAGSSYASTDGSGDGANRSDDQSESESSPTLTTPASTSVASSSVRPRLPKIKSSRSSSKLSDAEAFSKMNSKKMPEDNSFQTRVARLIKFAREEVDVVISQQNIQTAEAAFRRKSRLQNSESMVAQGGKFGEPSQGNGSSSKTQQPVSRAFAEFAVVEEELMGQNENQETSELFASRFIYGECPLSKNVVFALDILRDCIAHINSISSRTSLNFGEDRDLNNEIPLIEVVQNAYAEVMAPSLIVEVISGCRYACVVFAALELGIEVLAKGNVACQEKILWHLKKIKPAECSEFFRALYDMLRAAAGRFNYMLQDRHATKDSSYFESGTASPETIQTLRTVNELAVKDTGVILVLQFLQLLNEGHFHDIQMLMQSQESIYAGESGAAMGGPESAASSTESYPLLTAAVNLLEAFIPNKEAIGHLSESDADIVLKIFDYLTETVQGPCYYNQEVLAKSPVVFVVYTLLEFNIYTSSSKSKTAVGYAGLSTEKFKSVRVAGLNLLVSLLEGRQPTVSDPVYATLSNLDFTYVPRMLRSLTEERQRQMTRLCSEGGKYEEVEAAAEELISEGFVMLALGKYLAQMKPSIYDDLIPKIPRSMKRYQFATQADFQHAEKQRANAMKLVRSFYVFDDRLRSVEILWGDKGLFRFQFIMPLECSFLSEDTKKKVVKSLDFGDDERHKALIQNVYSIHDDVSLKKRIHDNHYFRLLVNFQDELDYAITGLAVFINFLLVISLQQGFYTGHDVPQFEPPEFKTVVRILTVIQVILLLYKLLQTLILRLPILVKENFRFIEKMRRIKTSSKSLTVGMKLRLIMTEFAMSITAAAVTALICGFVHTRYKHVPVALYALSGLLVAALFLRALEGTYRSVWTANYRGSKLVLTVASMLRDGNVRYHIVFAIFGILALDVHRPFFNAIIPLSIVKLSDTLQNVVRAITQPGVALTLSALLGFMMIFVFAIFAFFRFPTDFYNADQGENECGTLLLCLVTFLHGGLLSGGGIADRTSSLGHEPLIADSKTYGSRITYDLFFFVIITVLLLNIIFGIIIDTFGKLREDASEKRRLQRDFCFVCGISRDAFEAASHDHAVGSDGGGDSNDSNNGATKGSDGNGSGSGSGNGGRGVQGAAGGVRLDVSKGSGFAEHIKNEHNLWDYVFFLIYLKLKDENNYFGIESYVADLMRRDDVSWIPRGIAIRVRNGSREEENSETDAQTMKSSMDLAYQGLSSKIESIDENVRNDVQSLRDQLEEHAAAMAKIQESLDFIIRQRSPQTIST